MAGAGDYDKLVTLAEPVQAIDANGKPLYDEVGLPIMEWRQRIKVYANIRALSAREIMAAAQQQATSTHTIRMQPIRSIILRSTWRIEYGSVLYSIQGIIPEGTELIISAEVASYEQ